MSAKAAKDESQARPGNANAWQHGLYSGKPILRELLSEDEQVAWDTAAVPPNSGTVLEHLFRQNAVIAYRVERWLLARGPMGKRTATATALAVIDAMERPLRTATKLVEVEIRQREVDSGIATDDQLRSYLAQLPTTQLADAMAQMGELPRRDPSTGRLLLAGANPEAVRE